MNTYFRTGVVTLLLGFSLTACHEAKKSDTSAESTASERKLDFQSDDEFLTYIQKAHFNYMWKVRSLPPDWPVSVSIRMACILRTTLIS